MSDLDDIDKTWGENTRKNRKEFRRDIYFTCRII